jgi:hypothetical protein
VREAALLHRLKERPGFPKLEYDELSELDEDAQSAEACYNLASP